MYKIEKNVPLPTATKKRKYPFADMQKGDSFLVPSAKKSGSVNVMAVYHTKKTEGKVKFTIRKVKDGYRCWRIK